jgi:hypothetical protein
MDVQSSSFQGIEGTVSSLQQCTCTSNGQSAYINTEGHDNSTYRQAVDARMRPTNLLKDTTRAEDGWLIYDGGVMGEHDISAVWTR